uniref:Uncharacterized protein n=1 Tax=Ciona intestinalis TaxID=7719 RepID=H2Y1N4_CIOIN
NSNTLIIDEGNLICLINYIYSLFVVQNLKVVQLMEQFTCKIRSKNTTTEENNKVE